MTHHPEQLRRHAPRERVGEGMFVGGAVQAHLHELVVRERRIHGAHHGLGHAGLPYLNERPKRMSKRAQVAALEAVQHGAAEPTRARGLALAALSLFALLASACATPQAPTAAPAVAPPTRVELPSLQFQPAHTVEPAPVIDSLPLATLTSLEFARSVLAVHGRGLSAIEREGVARALVSAEQQYGLPIVSLLALIEQESRFEKRARGPSGSIGLMQLQPATAKHVAKRLGLPYRGEATLLDPVRNVHLGCAYLAELRETFGTTELALAAYNVGPGRVKQMLGRGDRPNGPYLKGLAGRAESLRNRFGSPETAFGG
jgi:hypothetical protein